MLNDIFMNGSSLSTRKSGLLLLIGLTALLGSVGCGAGGNLGGLLSGFSSTGGNGLGANAPSAADAAAGDIARAIEEADIVKLVGDRLYILNAFKGLLIVDVSDPDSPSLLGSIDLKGRGVEMYVVDTNVYVLLSADLYYAYDTSNSGGGPVPAGAQSVAAPGGPGTPAPPAPNFDGSQLAIIDVSDPTNPTAGDKINLVGFAQASRLVGDVIYVIGSNTTGYYYGPAEGDSSGGDPPNAGFVASVNVADPHNVIPVERKTFAGDALLMHVSDDAIFAASQTYDYDSGEGTTSVQYIDITDPDGSIALRGSFTVPGTIRNRFYMDDFDGVFRIATESWGFGYQKVRVFTYDLSDPDNVTPLGQADIIQSESLEAVRFDGPRGYAVTFLQQDPLFVLDLSDPSAPVVAGHLEVPGFSTHLEPRGDRLLAVGIDNTDGQRPAVSYYDVSDPANPRELGRIVLGPPNGFTDSDATYDEKAFKIVDELGLIAVPFQHVDYSNVIPVDTPQTGRAKVLQGSGSSDGSQPDAPACMNGVQLIDFNDTALTQRGFFDHRGRVQRVGVVGERLYAVSQAALQTVDISDRDNPASKGNLAFFDESELPLYVNDCGYYYGPPYGGPIGPSDPLGAMFQILFDGRLCGTVSVTPVLFLTAGLGLMKWTVRSRRTHRRN